VKIQIRYIADWNRKTGCFAQNIAVVNLLQQKWISSGGAASDIRDTRLGEL
jgi:hypothetical protein